MIPFPDRRYNIIYCDPPWKYRDKASSGKRGACHKYPVMALDELKALPVQQIAADDCLLAMWWVAPMPAEAIALVNAWGFTLKTFKGFTWHKETKHGKSFMGMGNWSRANTEDCLLAVRGKPKRVCAGVRQFVSAPIGRHSEKPGEVRDRLVQLMGEVPRIELFARTKTEGWDVWGNEITNELAPIFLTPRPFAVVERWCEETGYKDLRRADRVWWAIPPHGVIPVPISPCIDNDYTPEQSRADPVQPQADPTEEIERVEYSIDALADHPRFNKLAISFSGGRTSAVMTKLLLDKYSATHEIIVVFANTGCEHPLTLEFVRDCDRYWGFNTVWLEGVYGSYGDGVGVRHRVVGFETAARNGEPYEAFIRKYGIPNQTSPACSERLKRRVSESYLSAKGWRRGKKLNYTTAIGIRADELNRIGNEPGIWYPLAAWNTTKPMILAAMRRVEWDLKLPGEIYGNCVWCWKKTKRKLLTLAQESPEWFDFPARMEREYGAFLNDEKAAAPDGRHYFYREQTSTAALLEEAKAGNFKPWKDHSQCSIWDDDLDLGSGCDESCEPY